MTLARKVTANMALAVAGRIGGALFGLATTALITRYLGPDLFGAYRTALAWAVLGCTFANLGLSIICLRQISEPGADVTRIIGTGLTLRLGIGAISVVLTALAVYVIPMPEGHDSSQLLLAILLAGVGCVATLGNELITAIFQSALAQGRATIAELSGGAATLALTMFCVATNAGMLSIVAASTGGLLATFVVAAILAEPLAPVRLRYDPLLARSMLWIGMPVFVSEIVGMITLRVDAVALSLMSVPAEVGYYGIASKLREVGVKLPYLFGALIMPILVRSIAKGDVFNKRLGHALLSVWVFSVGVMLVLGCFADVVVRLIAGTQFGPAALSVQITGLALAASAIVQVLYSGALARDKAGEALKVHLIGAVVAVGGFAALIPLWGAAGAALAVALGEIAFAAGLCFLASPGGARSLPWSKLGGVTAVGVVCAGVIGLLRTSSAPWLFDLAVAGVLYPGLLLAVGLVKPSEIIELLRSRKDPV